METGVLADGEHNTSHEFKDLDATRIGSVRATLLPKLQRVRLASSARARWRHWAEAIRLSC